MSERQVISETIIECTVIVHGKKRVFRNDLSLRVEEMIFLASPKAYCTIQWIRRGRILLTQESVEKDGVWKWSPGTNILQDKRFPGLWCFIKASHSRLRIGDEFRVTLHTGKSFTETVCLVDDTVFRHEPTGLETRGISYCSVPLGTKVELFREGTLLAQVRASSVGTHAPMEGWNGDTGSILLGNDPSDYQGWRLGNIEPWDEGIHSGDILRLTMAGYELAIEEQYRHLSGGWPKVPISLEQRLKKLFPVRL